MPSGVVLRVVYAESHNWAYYAERQHNDIQYNDVQYNNKKMLSAVMLNVFKHSGQQNKLFKNFIINCVVK
jgi:hypothetical protein